jgi:hypothetical protein
LVRQSIGLGTRFDLVRRRENFVTSRNVRTPFARKQS